jgi:hypothetical protein
MTKKLEELLNIESTKKPEPVAKPEAVDMTAVSHVDLTQTLEKFDKISAALPQVKGLGDMSDSEFDTLASKAEQAYDDLMDLGMNVEARYGARMFEVAGTMLQAAINAKSAKIDKKLKMVDLQLKKLAIDQKNGPTGENGTVEGDGYVITDRNSLLEKLKNMNK